MLENVRNMRMEKLNRNIKGDELKKLTFFGPKRDSIIDYIVTNGEEREKRWKNWR